MVYLLLADGFEETEAIAPLDILRRMGAEVKTVGITGKTVHGAHGVDVAADIFADEADMRLCEMLVLPGGPGHEKLENSVKAQDMLRYAYDNGLYIGAICASPSIPGKLGMMDGVKGTCFTGYEADCRGMIYTGEKAVTDGRFITSRGAGTALEFGFALGEAIFGSDRAEAMRKAMLYK